jgi:Response regulators consisting of a CheY-like receiver domain and a winged-helix DNA-binding domain
VFGALSIDVAAREVHLDGEAVALTRTEFDVLEALSARPKLVFSRRQLIDAVWDQTWVGDEHLVDVHVGHLRRKLGDDPELATVRAHGPRHRLPHGRGQMKQAIAEPTRRGAGLAGRLLLAQVLVLMAGALTAWLVATIVGPSVFHAHLARSNVGSTSAQILHTERAFRSASAISLSLALLAALVAALGVSVYMTRRIGRSVATIATAASDVAGGHYDVRVPGPGLGPEFDALALGFNQMAGRLGSVEVTRRRLLAART